MAELAGGSASGQVILAACMLLAARFFDASDLGALGVTTSIATIVGTALAGRLELSLTVERDDAMFGQLAHYLRRWADVVAVAGGMWAAAVLAIGAAGSVSLTRSAVWAVVPVAAAMTLAANTEIFVATRLRSYRVLSAGTFCLGAAQGLTLAIFGLVAPNALTASLSYVISRLSATILLRRRQPLDRPTRGPGVREILDDRREYLYSITPGHVLTNATAGIPTLFLANSFGLTEAGIYFVVSRMIQLPIRTMSTAVSRVLFGEISAESDGQTPLSIMRPFLLLAGGLGLAGLTLAVSLAQMDLGRLLGPSWIAARGFLVPITLAAVAQLAFSPLAFSLLRLERFRAVLALQVGRFVLIMLPPCAHWIGGLSLLEAVWWVNIALAVSHLVSGYVSYTAELRFR